MIKRLKRKLFSITALFVIFALIMSMIALAQADNSQDSDSSLLDIIWDAVVDFFSGDDLITGAVTFTPTDCDSIYGDPGVVSYWTFDNGDATDDYDANHGTVNGATSATGQVNTALDFDGVDDYIFVADDTSLDMLDTFSISAWVSSPWMLVFDSL